MSFITEEEFTSHVYEENIDIISRDDPGKLEEAIDAAVSEASGYMSRFDSDTLFAATGSERDPILVMYIKDIAKWHFMNICNAGTDLTLVQDRYEKAIKWFEKVQAGRVVPRNWPLINDEVSSPNYFHVKSNPKRGNYY